MTSDVLSLLCSTVKLNRDRGVAELQRVIPNCTEEERLQLESNLLHLTSSSESAWETKHGCLLGSKALLPYINLDDERETEFLTRMKQNAEKLLTDLEVRVRMAAGEYLGALCAKIGPLVYQECKDFVLQLIRSNLQRLIPEDEASRLEQIETEKLMEKLAGPSLRRNRADATQKFHDTAGWKNLETSLKCLQAMIEGCETNFQPFVDEELVELIFQTLLHTNRFVRETGFYVCAALVSCGNINEDLENRDSISPVNPIFEFGHEFSNHLANGLADNWSQVRLAASVATRKFLLSLPNNLREIFYPILLPRMCLNRYYVAEGVRNFSQETWRQITGVSGRELVQKHISQTVDYYIQATESENHAVREAACACVAELAAKIQPHAVKPFVDKLLKTLLLCFQDKSWPVRDAACLASGNFILCFPEESQHAMPSLYPMFFRNMEDPILSVRQGAAVSLANIVRAYNQEALNIVNEKLTSGLLGIRNQQAESEKYRPIENDSMAPGLMKKLRDNNPELHSDNQMYSCGSLAPKLGRGCSDHTFQRPSQPWECADGCVYLLAELSQLPEASCNVIAVLPLVAQACQQRNYSHHLIFLETVCKQLPVIARNVGKKSFKNMMEDFFDSIFYALESENSLTSSAASQCLNQLGTIIGPNILRAKVERHNPRFLHHLDANVFIAPF